MSEISGALSKLRTPLASDVFTTLYENLLITNPSRRPGSVLVCCASPGEGATTIASGLALAAARLVDGCVLLVDCDRRKYDRSEYFNIAETLDLRGFIEALGADWPGHREPGPPSPPDDAWIEVTKGALFGRTFLPNLWRMGFPGEEKSPITRIESPKFKEFLQWMGNWIPFSVVDGPPVNACPDSVLLAAQVSRVLFVVHAEVTRVPVALEALSKLGEGVRHKIEVVLNHRAFAIPQKVYDRL